MKKYLFVNRIRIFAFLFVASIVAMIMFHWIFFMAVLYFVAQMVIEVDLENDRLNNLYATKDENGDKKVVDFPTTKK
jgi:hypothetical protein